MKSKQFSRFALIALGVLGLAGGLAAQGMQQNNKMKKMDMNNTPYAKVKHMMSSPELRAKARAMAKKNNVVLMGGMPVGGENVTLKGELTGANCYLSSNLHGHNHALCAKACVANGSPVIFIAEDGTVYTVLTPKDGMPLPEKALDNLGRPGVTVEGVAVKTHGVNALAVQSVEL